MAFCTSCGATVPPGGAFCPSCGAGVAGAGAPPTAGVPPPPTFGYAGVPFAAAVAPITPAVRAADLRALTWIRLAAILGIIGGVLGYAELFAGSFSNLFNVTAATGGGRVLSNPSVLVYAYIGVGGAIGLAELFILRFGFRTLSGHDREFSTPSTLTLVAIVSVAVLLVGVSLLFAALAQAISCVGAGNAITTGCLFTGLFWASLAVLLIGAIAALVGYIGGVLLGTWRLGRRFDETLFKVGAILLIFLPFVGSILILIGAQAAMRKDGRSGPVQPAAFPGPR